MQLIKALQPLIEAAEATLELDATKRARTIICVDAGAGTLDDLNWLLSWGYEVVAKEYSGRRVLRLAKTVTEWVQDLTGPNARLAGRLNRPWAMFVPCNVSPCDVGDRMAPSYGVMISFLSTQQVLALQKNPSPPQADPTAVLLAYVTFYDQRGGGIETSLKDDKQGLGLTKRNKKRFEAQHMLALLGSLAHNVVVWAQWWLSSVQIQHCGILRIVRDVFHISGLLRFDASGSVVAIVLNQEARLARSFICPLQSLLGQVYSSASYLGPSLS